MEQVAKIRTHVLLLLRGKRIVGTRDDKQIKREFIRCLNVNVEERDRLETSSVGIRLSGGGSKNRIDLLEVNK